MKINTLVKHKKIEALGIGCISKILSKKVKVNFGTNDVITFNPNILSEVDVSQTKTVPFDKFRSRILNDKSTLNYAIVGNELKQFVGIGWITVRVITQSDLKKYPRVI